jgi:glyoxylase-like metal-dependent hydrolase (beta-lactamase superfamily II)
VRPKDVAAIVLTHGHADHAGAASDLREVTGAPIILGRADESLAADGRNSSMVAQGLEGRLIRPFVPTTFPAFRADLLVDDVLDLRSYGVVADLHATGGHTPGSTIVRFASGDVIVGDLLRGGRLGGRISPQLPFCHYYAADPGAVARVLRDVLATRPTRLYVGHGGPLDGARVATRFDRVVPGGPR